MDAFPENARGKPVVIFGAVYAGPLEEGRRILQPLREFGTPLVDLSGPTPFTGVQTAFDPFFPKGALQYYWKSLYLDSLKDDVIAAIAARAMDRPSPRTMINVWSMGGAMSRVSAEETAFGDRSAAFLLEISSTWEDAQDSERNIGWTRDFWANMEAIFRWRGLSELPRSGRRARGPGPSSLWRELRATGCSEAEIRPPEPFPPQPEHQADGMRALLQRTNEQERRAGGRS